VSLMPVKKKQKEEKSKLLYLKAASVEDICRYACRFDSLSGTLILEESNQGNKLIALGERIEEVQLAYFFPIKESGGMIAYEPAVEGAKDRMRFTTLSEPSNKYFINVMRIDLSGYEIAKGIDSKRVQMVRVKDVMDLIGAVIRKAAKEETIANVYSFVSAGKRVIAAFEVIDALASERPVFYYAFAESKSEGNFARFDYRNNSLDFTNTTGDHAYLYAKIINLSEPFPFFKK